jgi:acyl carrier protein
MTHVPAETAETVRAIIADVLEIDAAELTEESNFEDDFGADSLLVIEMFSRFEKELGISIPQEDLVQLNDLSAAYQVVGRSLKRETVGV